MELHPASLSAESNMSSPPSSSSSPPASPASSASSWDQDQEIEELKTPVRPFAVTPPAIPEGPLVSILCNPKHGTGDAPAGELTRPTVIIPEADANSPAASAAHPAAVSPTAAISAIKTVFAKKKSTPNLKGSSAAAGGKKAAAPALGKSFKRQGPPPLDGKGRIQGAPLLDHDPRSESEDGGGSTPSSYSDTTQNGFFPASTMQGSSHHFGASSEKLEQRPFRDRFGSVPDAHYYGAGSGTVGHQARSQGIARSNSNASSYRSDSSTGSGSRPDLGTSPHSIRFCPLPETGRLKRANSITIGIAARSQMLLSQGSGPVPRAQNQAWANNTATGKPTGGMHPSDPRYAGIQNHRAAAWYEAGGELPDDVIDVGAELRKVGKLAWKKMRGGGGDGKKTSSTDSRTLSASPPVPPPKPQAPRAKTESLLTKIGGPAPPVPSKLSKSSNDQWLRASDSNLLRNQHGAAADGGNDDEADGMKTPRANGFGGTGGGPATQQTQSLIVPISPPATTDSSRPNTHYQDTDSTTSPANRRVSAATFLNSGDGDSLLQSLRYADTPGAGTPPDGAAPGTRRLSVEDRRSMAEDALEGKEESSKSGLPSLLQLRKFSKEFDGGNFMGGALFGSSGSGGGHEVESEAGANVKTPKKEAWSEEQRKLAEHKIEQQKAEERGEGL